MADDTKQDNTTESNGAAPSQAATQGAGAGGTTEAKPAKRAGVATGVQAQPDNPAEGVEVFPGVSADRYNAQQAKRREQRSDTF